jgi:hypothetical protein
MKNKRYSSSNKTFSNQIYFPHNIKNINEEQRSNEKQQSNDLLHLHSSSGSVIRNK